VLNASTTDAPITIGIPRTVAVIAVHGVGKHVAGETENSMADLLLSLPSDSPYGPSLGLKYKPRLYSPFKAIGIQIPLQPIRVDKLTPKTVQLGVNGEKDKGFSGLAEKLQRWWTSHFNIYQERTARFAIARGGVKQESGATGREFTQMLLDGYQGGMDSNAYITTRLEGGRANGASTTGVHIYEVLWSDIAKPDNTVLKFFLALFQLILHLATLSRVSLDTGSAEGDTAVWKAFRVSQRWAVRTLLIFLPCLQLILAVAIAACFSTDYSGTSGQWFVPYGLGAIGGLGLGLIYLVKDKNQITRHPLMWSLYSIVPAILGGLFSAALLSVVRKVAPDAVSGADVINIGAAILFWLVPGLAIFSLVIKQYETLRTGVTFTGYILYGVSGLLFLAGLAKSLSEPEPGPLAATVFTGIALLAAIRIFWILLIVFASIAMILGAVAWRSHPTETESSKAKRGRARAAVRTSRLALALPSILFFVLTGLLWHGFLDVAVRVKNPILPDGIVAQSEKSLSRIRPATASPVALSLLDMILPPNSAFFPCKEPKQAKCCGSGEEKVVSGGQDCYLVHNLSWAAGYQIPITLGLALLGFFLLLWWGIPSVLTERFPYRGKKIPPRYSTDAVSLRMGSWISRGLDASSVVTFLLWTAVFLAPAAYLLLDIFDHIHGGSRLIDQTIMNLTRASDWIAGASVIASAGALAALAKGGETVLGTVLDVDTYLRSTPKQATPRAKIFERYASVLHYVDEYRDEHGRPYDSIVIVAHSLGALISGDLLHFMHSDRYLKGNPAIQRPVKLLTMGNPTRQLLNRFFPYLYDWVRAVPDNGLIPLSTPSSSGPAPPLDESLPDPKELGVQLWVNAYRSGDYVGRSVWLDEWYQRPDDETEPSLSSSPDGTRNEMCIGAGAHTHYMDDTAPEIAWMLDQLIDRVAN
jgi:hypothetical protein